ncbi:MAG: hypothetical protein Q3962_09095, partial [Corynebacterium sp.]|nr:hypothetical protein [Corynebacterium sp.]
EAYNPLYEKLTGQPWSHETPIRDWAERQRAMAEIDVIVAKAFGITLEELIFLYTKMFPTFYTKDQAAALALENHHTRDYYYSRFFDTI